MDLGGKSGGIYINGYSHFVPDTSFYHVFPTPAGQLKLKMSAVGESPLDPATPESRKRKGSPCDTSGQR